MRRPSEYIKDRNKDLWRVYQNIVISEGCSSTQIVAQLAASRSKRFWISPEQATKVVNRMIAGDSIDYMKPHRREMFYELFNRYQAYKSHPKYRSLSTPHIMVYVVEEEAPSFYLTNGTIQKLLSSIKHRRNA